MILLTLGLSSAAVLELRLESRDAARLTASETFVQLGGSRVRYRLSGADRTGAPVVLLTGALASIEQWELVAPEIALTRPVVSYDRGGLGFSTGSHAHSAAAQADELAQLLVALHLKQPVVLLGFSSSSLVERLFAERYPQYLAGLVLLDPDFPEYELELRGPGHGVIRAHLRSTSTGTATALLGVRRLRAWLSESKLASLDDERSRMLLVSFHFCWAESRMLWATPESQREVLAAQGPLPPLIIFSKHCRRRIRDKRSSPAFSLARRAASFGRFPPSRSTNSCSTIVSCVSPSCPPQIFSQRQRRDRADAPGRRAA